MRLVCAYIFIQEKRLLVAWHSARTDSKQIKIKECVAKRKSSPEWRRTQLKGEEKLRDWYLTSLFIAVRHNLHNINCTSHVCPARLLIFYLSRTFSSVSFLKPLASYAIRLPLFPRITSYSILRFFFSFSSLHSHRLQSTACIHIQQLSECVGVCVFTIPMTRPHFWANVFTLLY